MSNKSIISRIQAAIEVLKGNDIYWKDGKLVRRQRTDKGQFKGVEISNSLESSLKVLRMKLKNIVEDK